MHQWIISYSHFYVLILFYLLIISQVLSNRPSEIPGAVAELHSPPWVDDANGSSACCRRVGFLHPPPTLVLWYLLRYKDSSLRSCAANCIAMGSAGT